MVAVVWRFRAASGRLAIIDGTMNYTHEGENPATSSCPEDGFGIAFAKSELIPIRWFDMLSMLDKDNQFTQVIFV